VGIVILPIIIALAFIGRSIGRFVKGAVSNQTVEQFGKEDTLSMKILAFVLSAIFLLLFVGLSLYFLNSTSPVNRNETLNLYGISVYAAASILLGFTLSFSKTFGLLIIRRFKS
jgi:hypothetical protein